LKDKVLRFEGIILKPSLDASILKFEIFRDDFDGIARLTVPIRKVITTKIIINSMNSNLLKSLKQS
jgi:hypothetical protein